MTRACLLVGGGDAPGVNAILRAFAHAARRHEIELLGSRYGFEGLLDPDGLVPLGVAHVRGILPRGGSILGCSTRVNPFFAMTKDHPEPRDMGPSIVDRLRSAGIDALVLVGGDGTMLAASRFMKLGMGVIGVPKTIDNDLGETDLSCGFDTAVGSVTRALDALHSTAEAHARVMVVEVMGRNAGWIALHAGVAGGADVVLVPEIPYRIERVAAKIREREALGLRFSILVVAEGARPMGEEALEVQAARPGLLPRLGGAGARLVAELEELELGHEVRLTVLGHLQRGGSPSAFDRMLATQMGTYAAALCRERSSGRMVAWRDGGVTSIELPSEERLHKVVDPRGSLATAARLVGIELGG